MNNGSSGELNLGHLFQAAGLNCEDVMVIRHTLNTGGLASRAEAMGPGLLAYTRVQRTGNKVRKSPPKIWLNFLVTSGYRARFLTTFENHGEIREKSLDQDRYFDLRPSEVLSALQHRLVIEWTADPVNWAKYGESAGALRVVEIADPVSDPFPGFDSLLVSFDELQAIITDDRYEQWRTALSSVQGIYLIADTSTGRLYVGKADGTERFLGRWGEYARNGHGGNVALRELAAADARHRQHFQFSILQVFSPSAPAAQVDAAEAHFKRALLTRQFGMNLN